MYHELQTKRVLIFGCGNVLMGDDGFGPAVIKRLRQHHDLPDFAHAEDVGTSVRDILFNITLLEKRPEHIIVIDAVDKPGRSPGEVFEIPVDAIPEQKIVDYSFHQFPTSNLLKELQDACGLKVTVVAAQTGAKLEQVEPGLSTPMRAAVREAAQRVADLVAALG
jgi:coenzyme F420 hydrogenase subunit delta